MHRFPQSIAIAGAWGYVGRKLLDAALSLGMRVYVHDPGKAPEDVDLAAVNRIADEEEFYGLPADLFHLALHPETRRRGEDLLLRRGRNKLLWILDEKPMAAPECPEECARLLEAAGHSQAVLLYDFPELYDPLTRRIAEHLSGLGSVEITSLQVERGKDREASEYPRNYKRMVPIQYQETVHCLAFVLHLLGGLARDLRSVFADGLSVVAGAEPYAPPNPEDYPYVVDGKCDFQLSLGRVAVEGHTNFKRGAEWTKRRVIRGVARGKPFTIEADYFEGRKRLLVDGTDQNYDPRASSYEAVINTLGDWHGEVSPGDLRHGLYPNPRFAWHAYQLSSVLWRSSYDRRRIDLGSLKELEAFEAGFAAAAKGFPRYGEG